MANAYGLKVPRRKKNPKGGHPTKYKQPTVDAILQAVEVGAPDSVACLEAGISEAIYYEWKNRYPEFMEAVNRARAASHLSVIKAVKRSIHGYPCPRCNALGTEDGFTKEGELLEVKCIACAGTGFSVKPDGKLGLALLERRLPESFAKVNTTDVRVTGAVQVDVVQAEVQLNQLTPEQIADLAWDDEEPLMIEAED